MKISVGTPDTHVKTYEPNSGSIEHNSVALVITW
jgi:hypothetical protein